MQKISKTDDFQKIYYNIRQFRKTCISLVTDNNVRCMSIRFKNFFCREGGVGAGGGYFWYFII